jgi:hypothetical protein
MKILKNKIFIKLLVTLFLITIITAIFSWDSVVNAAGTTGAGLIKSMETQASGFLKLGQDNASKIKYSKVTDPFVGLGQILTMVGAGVLVAVTAYMGIKYLTSGPEAQAKLKTQLIGVVVSAMVIFGAYFIWSTVVNVASTF